MILLFALAMAGAAPQPANSGCAFTLSPNTGRAEIVGATEVVRSSRVIDQPDSPLRVVRVDLSAAMFGRTGAGIVSLDVLNASDRPIHGGAVGIAWRAGYVLTPSSVTFKSVLAPSATMRLDARLSDDLMIDVTTAAVVVSVRSVSFERCTYEPALAATRGVFTKEFGFLAGTVADACAFTAAPDTGEPQIAGPAELVTRVRVPRQPGSPLRIRRVDVSRLRLNIGETWVQLRGRFAIEVQNVSDREIDDADVQLLTRAGGPAGGDAPPWKGTLKPGKTMELRSTTLARFADFQPGATASDLQLVAVVDRVTLGTCDYRPARH